MGGEVAFSIRKNGKQETREFSKQAASHISTADFFAGKGAVHEDWKKAVPRLFAPIDYGLVAVDYDHKWVGSVQDYTHLDTQFFSGIRYRRETEHAKTELSKLFRAGRLLEVKGFEDVGLPGSDGFDAWFSALMQASKSRDEHSLQVKVAPPKGWTVVHFPGNRQGWEEFTKHLVRRGWQFSDEDMSAWEEFAQHRDMGGFSIQSIRAQSIYEDLDSATITPSLPRPASRL